ncbi:MAG: GNAT family N-acetyltransferase [Pseudonocardia sp.]|nr:GNAT family N-acetyltransferase [Pseudonocardia sp.]
MVLRPLDDDLAARWDRLALDSGAPAFVRPGWLGQWAKAFGKSAAMRALTVERGGELVAVLPLLSGRGGLTLSSPTNSETAVFAPVAADADAAAALGEELLGLRTVSIDLNALAADDPNVEALRAAAGTARASVLSRTLRHSPYIDVSGDPAAFDKRLSKNRRHGLKRLTNRLRDAGELTFDVHDGRAPGGGLATDLGTLLREGYKLEAREWKLAAGSAILSSPAVTAFYTAGARWAAEQGILRLVYLRLDGRPIAFGYCLQQGRTLSFLKLGMDDEFQKQGPGMVITRHLIDYAFAEPGVAELDLLGENDAYKADLASGTREQVRMQVFPNRRIGPAQRAAVVSVAGLRASLVERLPDPARDRLSALRNRLRR